MKKEARRLTKVLVSYFENYQDDMVRCRECGDLFHGSVSKGYLWFYSHVKLHEKEGRADSMIVLMDWPIGKGIDCI